jgi:hypothetical protein
MDGLTMSNDSMPQFRYNSAHNSRDSIIKIVSNDPDIWVQYLSITREQESYFLLNWRGKKIVFSAQEFELGDSGNQREVIWTILNIGVPGRGIAAFVFDSEEERRSAAEMALAALWAFNGPRAPWSKTHYMTADVKLVPALESLVYGGYDVLCLPPVSTALPWGVP